MMKGMEHGLAVDAGEGWLKERSAARWGRGLGGQAQGGRRRVGPQDPPTTERGPSERRERGRPFRRG